VTTKTVAGTTRLCGDEEAFLWAIASLGEVRRDGKRRSAELLEAVAGELTFDLGARRFPPTGARATRALSEYHPAARSAR
jgi:hypothetical protein